MKSHLLLLMSVFLTAGQIRAQERPVLSIELNAQAHPIIQISVSGETNKIYGIESKTDLAEAFWLTRDLVGVTSPGGQWTDPVPVEQLQRFYRAVKIATIANMVWISPGTFTMGSPSSERNRRSDEGPQTVVTLTKGFGLGRCEVTQREYVAVMGTNPSYFTGDLDLAVEQVSWNQAVEYCNRLTAQERAAGRLPTGYEYRLPTEAQWEYACRAGTTTRFSFGDVLECDDECGSCSIADQYMWWCGNSGNQTHRVGQKLWNPWSPWPVWQLLDDMQGNVWEWCWDWYSGSYPGGSVTDPTGPASGLSRVFRGGGWLNYSWYCRSAIRDCSAPYSSFLAIGFRTALVTAP